MFLCYFNPYSCGIPFGVFVLKHSVFVIPRFYLFVFSKSCVCIYVIMRDLAKQDCHNFSFPLFQSYFKVIFQCCKNSKSFCILSPKIIKMLEHFILSLGGLSLRIFLAKVVSGHSVKSFGGNLPPPLLLRLEVQFRTSESIPAT